MVSFRTTSKLRLLAAAAPLGLLALATPVQAQDKPAAPAPATTDDQAADTSPDIVVTGTLFRRADNETPSPVTTITADSIEKRGLTTVSDVVNSLAAGNGGAVPQNFTGAFASGATAVSLRGLSTNSTLTLFDGLRPAYYPLADDGQRSIVDLNTIPSAIVERIEVVRDGASSTYGADAIAGVVNVITKKEIKGLDARVEAGISERGDSDSQRIQLTGGFGSLSEQGYNFYVSGEYQRLGSVYNRDREFPYNTNNLTSLVGRDAAGVVGGGYTGRNGNFGFTPPTSGSSSGATVAVVRPATPTANSSGIPFGTAIAGGLFQVLGNCAQDNTILHTTTAGSYCEQDLINRYGVIQPRQTRFGGTARFTVNIGSKAQAYLTANFYQSKVFIDGTPQSIRSNGNPLETRGISLPVLLSNGQLNPQNPFAAAGQAALIYYRFGDIPSNLTNLSRTYRVATGIDGKFGADESWGYSFGATYSRTDLEQTRRGFLNIAGLTKAINDGTYNFVNPSLNTATIRNQISPTLQTRANSELWQVQGFITKDLFQLAGGPLQFGVGAQERYEAQYDPNPVPLRDFITVNPFSAVGNRYVSAAFFEVNAPILKQLEINASGRYDHYSIGFSHFSPKIGAKFQPIKELAIRGTYSEGFRAPSIPELSGAVIGFVQYTPSAAVQALYGNNSYITSTYGLGQNSTGNPNVKPETSRSFTGGIVFQPKSWLSMTVDYYNIRKKNLIIGGSGGPAAIADAYLLSGVIPAGVTITPNPVDPAHPGLRPTPLSINFLYGNGNVLQTSGIDAQIQATFKLSDDVKFTSILEGTEILDYTVDDGSIDPVTNKPTGPLQYVGTLASYVTTSASGTPRWRANWQNTLEVGAFSLTGTTYFTSGYKGYAADNLGLGCDKTSETSALYTNGGVITTTGGPLQCTVKHFIDFDVSASVKINNNFKFYVNVVNAFNTKAPFDPNTYGGNNYNPAWSSAGVIGRLFRAGATVKF